MRRVGLALAVLAFLAVGFRSSIADAQEACVHRPVLRAAAGLVRKAVCLVIAPIRLLVHHHDGCYFDGGYGCDGQWNYAFGYGYENVEQVRPAASDSAPADLPQAAAPASYTPVVAPDAIDRLSTEERRAAAGQAMSRGLALYRKGEIEVAREYFSEATALMPDWAAAWGLCGVAASAANDCQAAAQCADRVRALTAANADERSSLYRMLAPMQGASRVQFEQLVRNTDLRQPIEHLVGAP